MNNPQVSEGRPAKPVSAQPPGYVCSPGSLFFCLTGSKGETRPLCTPVLGVRMSVGRVVLLFEQKARQKRDLLLLINILHYCDGDLNGPIKANAQVLLFPW